jgi:hypothetical protein
LYFIFMTGGRYREGTPRALGPGVSQPLQRVRRQRPSSAPQRIRVAHGAGEIELLVQVVDSDRTSVDLPRRRDDDLVQLSTGRPPQESVGSRSNADGFALAPGGRIGKYELRDKLGQGTFGLVFVARDLDLDRDVAIKILHPSHQTNGDILHRFLQEARASARIVHPGIVTVLDCGTVETGIGDSAYIVLERLQGESVTSRLARSGKLAPTSAIEIARQIASAIDAAHRADVLHRDLKPDNIYLVPDPAVPSGERVKVLDFGLARIGASKHTMMNTVFGTPRYMSPEQCRSAALIDQRSDIYSLGCVLFELVTGRPPFDGDLRTIIDGHQRGIPPRARMLSPEVSDALDELIAQMLAKDPTARPQTMAEVQTALQYLGAVSPGVAATMMPVAANLIGLPYAPAPGDSGLMLVPPSDLFVQPRKRRGVAIAACALAFTIAAVVTAVVTRGHTKAASADPVPTVRAPTP